MRHYRRRRRSSNKNNNSNGKSNNTAKAVIILCVFCAALYIGLTSSVGNLVAKNVIAPILSLFEKEDSQEAADVENTVEDASEQASSDLSLSISPDVTSSKQVSRQIDLEPHAAFAVQLGAFSNQTNAINEAESAVGRGAAGFVLTDEANGLYRVFASVYSTQEDAKKVKNQLFEQSALETTVFALSSQGASIKVTASEEQIKAVEEAFNAISAVDEGLYDLCTKHDKKSIDDKALRDGLIALNKKLEKPMAALTGTKGLGEELKNTLTGVNEQLSGIINSDISGANLSSASKYAHLKVNCDYAALLEKINKG